VERKLPSDELTRLQVGKDLPDLTPVPISIEALTAARTWTAGRLSQLIRSAVNEGWLRSDSHGHLRMTQSGTRFAARAVRNHRLWELYLIHFADVDLSRVDRDADLIEHVLEPGIIDQLETLLKQELTRAIPTNPHG
jgi:manganese/zinc/iron transport system permease protein